MLKATQYLISNYTIEPYIVTTQHDSNMKTDKYTRNIHISTGTELLTSVKNIHWKKNLAQQVLLGN